jgi:peptidyl-tRNA hydrolase, PTH1 family
MSKFLLVGLGNIGAEYAHTRHNIGFDVLDFFVAKHGANFQTERLADMSNFRFRGKTLVCIKPSTYMNLSGRAVKYWMDREKISLNNMLIIVDELALPLSKLRLKAKGGHAGHNGLKSIEEILGTTEYPRLRFGIGNEFPKGMQVDFVLGKWTESEKIIVAKKIEKCSEAIESYVIAGPELTMNSLNNLDFGT